MATLTPTGQNKPQMNNILQEMYALISRHGFMMMGASTICFDNEIFRLTWAMGSGAKCTHVAFSYAEGTDLYELEFIRKDRNGERKSREFVRVYTEDVRPLIESETGFCLRLF